MDECPSCAAGQNAPAEAPTAPPSARGAAAAPPDRHGRPIVPGWLATILVAAVLVGAGGVVYKYGLPSSRESARQPAPAPLEQVTAAPAESAKAHPLAKYIEVTGFRVTEDARKNVQVKYVLVNHSGAEIGDLGLELKLRPATARPEDEPIASFAVKVPVLAPYEAKDLLANAKTRLRAYELPDWQFLRAEFEITSPAAGK